MPLSERPAPPKTRRGPRCSVCVLFQAKPESEWHAVERWRTAGVTWPQIAAAINDEYDANLSGTTVSRHARGDCRS